MNNLKMGLGLIALLVCVSLLLMGAAQTRRTRVGQPELSLAVFKRVTTPMSII